MWLVIAPPWLVAIGKQHRIIIHVLGGHDQHQRQRTSDPDTLSARGVSLVHAANLFLGGVKNVDAEFVSAGRIGVWLVDLVLRDVESAPAWGVFWGGGRGGAARWVFFFLWFCR